MLFPNQNTHLSKLLSYILPDERLELAEELWSSVEESLMPITNEEIAFAEERLKVHEANPDDGMSVGQLKKQFADKYGFITTKCQTLYN